MTLFHNALRYVTPVSRWRFLCLHSLASSFLWLRLAISYIYIWNVWNNCLTSICIYIPSLKVQSRVYMYSFHFLDTVVSLWDMYSAKLNHVSSIKISSMTAKCACTFVHIAGVNWCFKANNCRGSCLWLSSGQWEW